MAGGMAWTILTFHDLTLLGPPGIKVRSGDSFHDGPYNTLCSYPTRPLPQEGNSE